MAEYIEREALLQDIEDSVHFTAKTGRISPEMRGANKIIDRIKCAPAADVAPVAPGQWEEWLPGMRFILTGEEMLYMCSNCTAKYEDVEGKRYCPNCGAKMDGGEDIDCK